MVKDVVDGVERIAKDEKGNYGTIHILRKLIYRIFGPPLCVEIGFYEDISQESRCNSEIKV